MMDDPYQEIRAGHKVCLPSAVHTACPRNLALFYMVTNYLNWAKTSWTDSREPVKLLTPKFRSGGPLE